MTGTSEHTLVKGVLHGDARCEEALYRQYSVPMFRVCLRYAHDRAEAEDIRWARPLGYSGNAIESFSISNC